MSTGTEAGVPLLDRRCIEAAALAALYETLVARFNRETALAVVGETLDRLAREAGRAFAASAPDGPSLAHFASTVDAWRRGGALCIENYRQDGRSISFDVTRCRYAENYRDMGLPEELATRLSCDRDAPFAAGYSPKLKLSRPETIAAGAGCCPFTFTWED